jgi:hypothetical protein
MLFCQSYILTLLLGKNKANAENGLEKYNEACKSIVNPLSSTMTAFLGF